MIGKRASGKSSILSDISHSSKGVLTIVNTDANARHHTSNSPGSHILFLECPLETGELHAYCKAWNVKCLLIDDVNATKHDAILTDALEMARAGDLTRLCVSLNHPLMIPTSILKADTGYKVDITLLSRYTDPLSDRVIKTLKCTYPFQFDANSAALPDSVALNLADSQSAASSSHAPMTETLATEEPSGKFASTVLVHTQSDDPKHSTCCNETLMSPCEERTWHIHPSE